MRQAVREIIVETCDFFHHRKSDDTYARRGVRIGDTMTRRRRWMIPPIVSAIFAVLGYAFGWPVMLLAWLLRVPISERFSWLPPGWPNDAALRYGTAFGGAYLGLVLGLAIMAVVMIVTEPRPRW
jgi:hypothetical protein